MEAPKCCQWCIRYIYGGCDSPEHKTQAKMCDKCEGFDPWLDNDDWSLESYIKEYKLEKEDGNN